MRLGNDKKIQDLIYKLVAEKLKGHSWPVKANTMHYDIKKSWVVIITKKTEL